jgi:hypothetical protein
MRPVPTIWASTLMTKPPVRAGSPAHAPSASPGSNRSGPRTTPKVVDQTTSEKVVDQTTSERSLPLLASAARSVAVLPQ